MSNLLKAGMVAKAGETRIIDYNELINQKLEHLKEAIRKENAGDIEGGFVQGLNVEVVENLVNPEEELQKALDEAEQIRADARAEAEKMLADARAEAEQLRRTSLEEGRNEGYQNGLEQARLELEKQRQALTEEKERQEAEYQTSLQQIEPTLVNVITDVFEKVFHILGEEKKDMILYLVNNATYQIESSKEFLIRVSKEDYPFLCEQKERLMENIPKSSQVEIIQDSTLKRNACYIETDGGIFDCSLDVQLEKLISDIKILSIS